MQLLFRDMQAMKAMASNGADVPPLPPAAAARLDDFLSTMERLASSLVGYPCSQDFDYPEIAPLLRFSLNNVGDPFGESLYRENTFGFADCLPDMFVNTR